jgi:hypothetical protein
MTKSKPSAFIEDFATFLALVFKETSAFNIGKADNGYYLNNSKIFTQGSVCFMQNDALTCVLSEEVFEKFRVFFSLCSKKENPLTIYLDGVDFQHEAGETVCKTFATTEQTLELSPCSKHCGVVKAFLVIDEWTHPQNLFGETEE